MNTGQSIVFWASTVLLALAFGLSIVALVFGREKLLRAARLVSATSVGSITVFGILRWAGTGHPPFVTLFESMITAIWFLLVIMFLVRPRNLSAAILVPVSLVAFLLMGWASSLSKAASPLSATLDNVWLFIHASFATTGAAALLVAASLASVFLLSPERLQVLSRLVERPIDTTRMPKTITNFLVLGLILWGVMIVSGAIWAHAAWGRYWAWDPIELWSLISWLLYGLILHVRLSTSISNRTFCWLTILAALTIVFSLWGVGYVYDTIHVYG